MGVAEGTHSPQRQSTASLWCLKGHFYHDFQLFDSRMPTHPSILVCVPASWEIIEVCGERPPTHRVAWGHCHSTHRCPEGSQGFKHSISFPLQTLKCCIMSNIKHVSNVSWEWGYPRSPDGPAPCSPKVRFLEGWGDSFTLKAHNFVHLPCLLADTSIPSSMELLTLPPQAGSWGLGGTILGNTLSCWPFPQCQGLTCIFTNSCSWPQPPWG